jgi:hypothetical protein
VAWRNDRYKVIRNDWQEEKAEIQSSEADESTLHRAYGSEGSRVHHL